MNAEAVGMRGRRVRQSHLRISMERLKPHFCNGGIRATNMQKMQRENNLGMGYRNQGENRHDNCNVNIIGNCLRETKKGKQGRWKTKMI